MPDENRPGQLRNGFNITARDLDRAFAVGGFEPIQAILIQQARELSYATAKMAGSAEPFPFQIPISALARDVGCSRQWLTKHLQELVRYRVFLIRERLYWINKDFRTWLDALGKPRLDPVQIRWCESVRRKYVNQDALTGNQDVLTSPVVVSASHLNVQPVVSASHLNAPLVVSASHLNIIDNPAPPAPPLVNGRATPARGIQFESSIEEREKTPFSTPHGGVPNFSSSSPPVPIPEKPRRAHHRESRETFGERKTRLLAQRMAELKAAMQDPAFFAPKYPPQDHTNGSTP